MPRDQACLIRSDGALERADLPAKLAGSDPDPEFRGVDSKALDLDRDPGRLMSVEAKDADAELELRRRRGAEDAPDLFAHLARAPVRRSSR